MKIIFVNKMTMLGKPVTSRISSFKRFYFNIGIDVLNIDAPCILSKDYLFISMPPFRNFWLFFIPGLKVILDIRDGWSIAQESGYGGNVKKKPFKAKISRIIERFAIRRSYLAITCTPGLQTYLSAISGREVLLIPNGISDDDLDLINELKQQQHEKTVIDELVFCCAGQFSEYGREKVELLLKKIADRYLENKLKIKLIGSNESSNAWVHDYFQELTAGKGSVEILPRMDKKELFSTMLKADYGLTILRDPSYELGTKIYDYIALGLPVVNYFETPNNFTDYFDACLDVSFNSTAVMPEIRRSVLIESVLSRYFKGS